METLKLCVSIYKSKDKVWLGLLEFLESNKKANGITEIQVSKGFYLCYVRFVLESEYNEKRKNIFAEIKLVNISVFNMDETKLLFTLIYNHNYSNFYLLRVVQRRLVNSMYKKKYLYILFQLKKRIEKWI